MYKVQQAIVMAAGEGKRLRPVTYATPKPLIAVRGVRMIDTILRALLENGIERIYIVVGYQKEKFRCLTEEYPGVTLIENPWYADCNNISSLYVAREHLENAIILDGDQIIRNSSALSPEFERSGYNAVWTQEPTREWLLTVEDGVVTHCSRDGGCRGWQLYSVSRWSREDGRRLKAHVEEEFIRRENRQIYWDDVALFCHPSAYRLGIRQMDRGDVVEVDELRELVQLDETYAAFLKGAEEDEK